MMKLTEVASLNWPIVKPSPAPSMACALSSITRRSVRFADFPYCRHIGDMDRRDGRE